MMIAASSQRRRATSSTITPIATTAITADVTDDREPADRASHVPRFSDNTAKASRSTPSAPWRGTTSHITPNSAPPANATADRTRTANAVDLDRGPAAFTGCTHLRATVAPPRREASVRAAPVDPGHH